MPFEVELRLNRIGDLFEFKNVDLRDDRLRQLSKRARDLLASNPRKEGISPGTDDNELMNESNSEEDNDLLVDLRGQSNYQSTHSRVSLEHLRNPRTSTFYPARNSKVSLELDTSNYDSDRKMSMVPGMEGDLPSTRHRMTPVAHRASGSRLHFQSMHTNASNFVVPQVASASQNMHTFETNSFYTKELEPIARDVSAVTTNKTNPGGKGTKKLPSANSSSRMWTVEGEAAIIVKRSLTESKLKELFRSIFQESPEVRVLIFRDNLFLSDPLVALRDDLKDPVGDVLTIDIAGNRFGKAKGVSEDVISSLLDFNIKVKV
jgi:hypothetical protein